MASSLEERLDDIRQMAFLDELVKIAEEAEPKKSGFGKTLRTMSTAAIGGGAGYGVAELLTRKLKFFNPPTGVSESTLRNRTTAARIILPILSGTAVMLADRYRQKLNEEYSKVEGYKGETKK